MKEYSHQFTKTEKVSNKTGKKIRERITKEIFPDIKARFESYLPESPKLTYILPALPVLGGTNEFTISMISYDGKEYIISLNVGTTGILGDVMNRKLKRTLESFNFIEEKNPTTREISIDEQKKRKETAFHLGTANKTIQEIVEGMQTGVVEARCLDGITNPDLGKYLEIVVNKEARKSKIEFYAKYSPQAQKLEVYKR